MTTETTTTEIVVSEAISTEGAALSVIHGKRESKARSVFRKDIAEGGFDVRLGNVMVELSSGLTEGQRISTKLIKAAGIAAIPSQRRSEALRLVTQREAIDTFLKENGKKFTSLTALFAAMDKQAKLDEKDTESDGDGEEEAVDAEAPAPTLEEIAASFIAKVSDSEFTIEQALDAVLVQLETKPQMTVGIADGFKSEAA